MYSRSGQHEELAYQASKTGILRPQQGSLILNTSVNKGKINWTESNKSPILRRLSLESTIESDSDRLSLK